MPGGIRRQDEVRRAHKQGRFDAATGGLFLDDPGRALQIILDDQKTWGHRHGSAASPWLDMPPAARHGKRSCAAIVTSFAERAQELRDEFALFDDWRDKLENVMDLGKALPPMEPALKTDASRVQGCQSQVWMVGTMEGDRLHFHAESDAILVKGLIALLLRLYDRLPPAEILANPPEVLKEIGLERYLTPSRSNGLYAMIGRIQTIAQAQAERTA